MRRDPRVEQSGSTSSEHVRREIDVSERKDPGKPRDPWKRKMGPEFSGFERTRDFLVAIGFVAALIGAGMVIAYLSFG